MYTLYINNEIMHGSGVDKLQQLQPLEKLKYVSKGTCELFATQALSQTQKNVSEPQTGIEPATF